MNKWNRIMGRILFWVGFASHMVYVIMDTIGGAMYLWGDAEPYSVPYNPASLALCLAGLYMIATTRRER